MTIYVVSCWLPGNVHQGREPLFSVGTITVRKDVAEQYVKDHPGYEIHDVEDGEDRPDVGQ